MTAQEKPPPLILVVEDESRLASVVMEYLHAENFRTHWEELGEKAIDAALSLKPALVLLDLNLPDIDGLTVCQEIRAHTDIPIMMLTARTEEIHRVVGLNAGADDYVCKPFSPNELVARVRAVLRRVNRPADEPLVSGLSIDERRHSVTLDGQSLVLTPVEFRLLSTLLNSAGRVYTRAQLLDLVYDDTRDITDRAIDSHVRNLRAKLREVRPDNEFICSVYGIGYKFDA